MVGSRIRNKSFRIHFLLSPFPLQKMPLITLALPFFGEFYHSFFWLSFTLSFLMHSFLHCNFLFSSVRLNLDLRAFIFPRIFMLFTICYSFCIPSFVLVVFLLLEILPLYFQGDGQLENGRRSLTHWWASHFSLQSRLQVVISTSSVPYRIDSAFFTRQLYIITFLKEIHSLIFVIKLLNC